MPKVELTKDQIVMLLRIFDQITIPGSQAELLVALKEAFRKALEEVETPKLASRERDGTRR